MKLFQKILPYFLAPLLVLLVALIVMRAWDVDFSLPLFSYGGDNFFHLFVIKNIVETGWFVTNDAVGLPHFKGMFSFYDFPIQSDFFNLWLLKLLSLITHNIFLIENLFFIITFVLIGFTAFVVLRSFNISSFSATAISVLYALLPYHFARNTGHLFLANYMIVPLSVMVGLWIASDKIRIFAVNNQNQYCVIFNRYFFIALLISILVATSGVYYAYYSCVIFIFALLIRCLKQSVIFDKNNLEPLILCLTVFVILVQLYLPTLFYQMENGTNLVAGIRYPAESEFYALHIIDIFLPVQNHYIPYFSNIREVFNDIIESGERYPATFGFIAANGFLFLILWLIGKNFSGKNSLISKTIKRFSLNKNEQNLISDIAVLNLLSVLFATVGGLVMFVSVSFPMIRSHARFCIFIAFLALFLIAIIFDKIVEKKFFGKKFYAKIAIIFLTICGVFDQNGRLSADFPQSQQIKNQFADDRNFVEQIENSLPSKSAIFVLPVSGFPEYDDYSSLKGYLHSTHLRWSYPAISGRENNLWQTRVSSLPDRDFLAEIKKAGFAGIYINRTLYEKMHGLRNLSRITSFIRANNKASEIISADKTLIFFAI